MRAIIKSTGEVIELRDDNVSSFCSTYYHEKETGKMYEDREIELIYTRTDIDFIQSVREIAIAALPGVITAMGCKSTIERNVAIAIDYGYEMAEQMK